MQKLNEMISAIIKAEGSKYTNDPNDSGGPTKYGITLATLSEYEGKQCTADDVKALTEYKARKVYENMYFYAPKFDLIFIESEKIAEEVLDTAVNCGVDRASKFLQRLLNSFNRQQKDYPDLIVDGKVGEKTADALEAFLRIRGKEGEQVLLDALNCLQGAFYQSLTERREKDENFFYGWLLNRVTKQLHSN